MTPGTTPPLKRPSKQVTISPAAKVAGKPTYSYAKVAEDALAVVVRASDGSHITRAAFDSVQRTLTDDFIKRVQTEAWTPSIEAQNYSNEVAAISASDERTQDYLLTEIAKLGYKACPMAEWKRTQETTVLYSGLLTGQTAHLRKDKLALLLDDQVQRNGIPGELKIFDTLPTNTGIILRLKATPEAAEGMKRVDNTLRFTLDGKVLFTEANLRSDSRKLDHRPEVEREKQRKRLQELEEGLARQRERLRHLEEEQDASSVASLGLSSLEVEQKQDDETPGRQPMEVTAEEAEKLLE